MAQCNDLIFSSIKITLKVFNSILILFLLSVVIIVSFKEVFHEISKYFLTSKMSFIFSALYSTIGSSAHVVIIIYCINQVISIRAIIKQNLCQLKITTTASILVLIVGIQTMGTNLFILIFLINILSLIYMILIEERRSQIRFARISLPLEVFHYQQ